MKVNIKLAISDSDRNLIARKLAGKDIKRLASRAEINELVRGFIEGYLTELLNEPLNPATQAPTPPDLSLVPAVYSGKSDHWKASYLRGRYGR